MLFTTIVIAKTVMPAPDPPVPQQLSVAVMITPPAGYMPQSSSEEDEDGEESKVHNEPAGLYRGALLNALHSHSATHNSGSVANIAPRRITHPGSHPRVRTPTGPSLQAHESGFP